MTARSDGSDHVAEFSIWIVAAAFLTVTTAASYARWANFEYGTFDLAYYVQALWQLLHLRFAVSILQTPLLGNHVEPIVIALAPIFAVLRHPITLVVIQNAALAAMGPIGFDIGRRQGLTSSAACAVAAALLVTPATGFVALHEFHPEAFAAPLLLLMYRARLCGSLRQHWLWFAAVLSCKENMALLLIAYCSVCAVVERRRGWAFVRAWSIWPAMLAAAWFVISTRVITPALNSGAIDYLALYDRLGATPFEIVRNFVAEPQRASGALATSLTRGNLLTATLLPFLCLPLLRPRWLVVAAPVVLQHLLSWRSSEWRIEFHYAAPLIALFWIASVEVVARLRDFKTGNRLEIPFAIAMIAATAIAQVAVGPAEQMWQAAHDWQADAAGRRAKGKLVADIPRDASVVAPLPFLSHLATRENCYSLHFILKGLKTLSRARFDPPPPTDAVVIDYGDPTTFDAGAGYYHPRMRTAEGGVVESSDELLHEFLVRADWMVNASGSLARLTRTTATASTGDVTDSGDAVPLGEGNLLVGIRRSPDVVQTNSAITFVLDWSLQAERTTFPWLDVIFTDSGGQRHAVTKGLCAVQVRAGPYRETWQVMPGEHLRPGTYNVEAHFFDNPKRVWARVGAGAPDSAALLSPPLPLGRITIVPAPPQP